MEKFLSALETAAQELYAERDRITQALNELEAAGRRFSPSFKLTGTAEVKPAEVKPAEVKPAEVKPAEVKPAEVTDATSYVELRAAVAEFVFTANKTTRQAVRPSAIDNEFIENREVSTSVLNNVLRGLTREGVLKREQSGRYRHKDYDPRVTNNQPTHEPSGGSGPRRDIAGTVKPSPKAPSVRLGTAPSDKPRSEMRKQEYNKWVRFDKIAAWALAQTGEFNALDYAREFNLDQAKTASDFNDMAHLGLLEKTDTTKHPDWKTKSKTMGRPPRWFKLGPKLAPKADPTPATQERASGADLAKVAFPTLEEIRDAAIELKTPNMTSLLEKLGKVNSQNMRPLIRDHMATLVNRKMFTYDTDSMGWTYIPPTDEGAAARIDRQRRPQAPERQVAEAVAGTGRGLRASRPEVQRLLDAITNQWGADKVAKQGNNHFVAIAPDGTKIRFAGTPSQRSMLNDFRKFRKAGLAF
jgi:hypothetical protein